jgi:hypothetical protein
LSLPSPCIVEKKAGKQQERCPEAGSGIEKNTCTILALMAIKIRVVLSKNGAVRDLFQTG